MIDPQDENRIIKKVVRKLQKPDLDIGDVNNVVNYHTHNGIDSPQINYKDLLGTGINYNQISGTPPFFSPAGSDTQVQYNDGGVLGADAQFTWTKGVYTLNVGIQSGTAIIRTPTATTTNNNGGALSLITGNGNGTGPGGDLTITTGSGGSNSSGGSFGVTCGNGVSGGLGGSVSFLGGNGGTTQTGGNASLVAGRGGSTSGNGGSLTLNAGSVGVGSSSGNGGAVSMNSGSGTGSGKNGGNITIQSGSGGISGAGGEVTLATGNAGNSGTSGNINFIPAAAPSGGTKGFVRIKDIGSSFYAKFDPVNITTADRTFTFPDASGTLALVGGGGSFTNTRVPFANSSGVLVDDADMTFVTDTLTVTKIVGSTSITASNLTSGRVVTAGTSGILQDDADLTFSGDTLTTTGLIVGTTKITSYNGISTVSNGVASEIVAINSTGLTANVAASTLYSVPASGEGMYRVSAYLVTTTAASISSTMPNAQVVYTDKDSDTSVTLDVSPILGAAGLGQSGLLTANTVGTVFSGTTVIYVKASTTIQYQTVNYASNLAGMTYALRMKLEAL